MVLMSALFFVSLLKKRVRARTSPYQDLSQLVTEREFLIEHVAILNRRTVQGKKMLLWLKLLFDDVTSLA